MDTCLFNRMLTVHKNKSIIFTICTYRKWCCYGSVLGPLLFLLYINDVTDVFNHDCKCKLYADDIKIYSFLGNACNGVNIQDKLDELQVWSDRWQLDISYKKCNALLLSNNKEQELIRRWDSERTWTFTQCAQKLPESAEITQNNAITPFKVIQGHRFWYQSKAHIQFPISD